MERRPALNIEKGKAINVRKKKGDIGDKKRRGEGNPGREKGSRR